MMTPLNYSTNDLLLLLGQCTVELAFLRARVVELETRLTFQQSSNGVVEPQTSSFQEEVVKHD